MRYLLLLLPAVLWAAPARYARLGDFDGDVEVQLTPASQWMPAERNLPLPESAWIRTGPASRVEIELDEGSVWRLGPESQGGLSDYTRHSTGQAVTLLKLEHGLAYFTGASGGMDSLLLVAPGAQVAVTKATRLRFEAGEYATQLAVLQGTARFSCSEAEIDILTGQTIGIEPSHPSSLSIYRKITPIDLDPWSASRDKTLASAVSALHAAQRYGLADLDASGQWIQTDDFGVVWQPKPAGGGKEPAQGWTPYGSGRWRWFDGLGYTWVSDDSWGWLPYHYGRWTRHGDLGWVWVPSVSAVFRPGDVFWLRGARFAAWGPLAPGEEWNPANLPSEFNALNMTYASFLPELPVIDPAGFSDIPKEPLKAGKLLASLPSLSLDPARFDAQRPLVAVNTLRVQPAPPPPPAPAPAPAPKTVVRERQPIIVVTPPSPPEEIPVPVPVYLGFIITVPQPVYLPPSNRGKQPAPVTQTASNPPKTGPKPIAIPEPLPWTGTRRPHVRPVDNGEMEISKQFDSDFQAARFTAALEDLDNWVKRYPRTELAMLRLYDYMQANSALAHPEHVVEYGAAAIAHNMQTDGALNDQQVVGLLYLTMINATAIAKPNHDQRAMGASAAQALLDSVPKLFDESRRSLSPRQWSAAREEIETAAREALKKLSSKPAA
jgi:hypothetical protein